MSTGQEGNGKGWGCVVEQEGKEGWGCVVEQEGKGKGCVVEQEGKGKSCVVEQEGKGKGWGCVVEQEGNGKGKDKESGYASGGGGGGGGVAVVDDKGKRKDCGYGHGDRVAIAVATDRPADMHWSVVLEMMVVEGWGCVGSAKWCKCESCNYATEVGEYCLYCAGAHVHGRCACPCQGCDDESAGWSD
jgi:hypothetical protein